MRCTAMCSVVISLLMAFAQDCRCAEAGHNDPLDQYNQIWDSPCDNSSGSMPLGNGDIGVNAWVDTKGDLLFYVGKTDAWSENGRLLKVGRLRLHCSPVAKATTDTFRQELRLGQAEMVVDSGEGDSRQQLRLWVDAHHPVVHVEVDRDMPFEVSVTVECWRQKRRELLKKEAHSAYSLMDSGQPVIVEPDTIVENQGNQLIWYHRNERSAWRESLELQAMGEFAETARDPLLHRTFGGLVQGSNLVRGNRETLRSAAAQKTFHLTVHLLTAQTPCANDWLRQVRGLASKAIELEQARTAHRTWWQDFWHRSWVRIDGGDTEETSKISLGWHLHRYLIACGGQGNFPIKFNGGIFNVDSSPAVPDRRIDQWNADYRAWGGPYWFQNTRQFYWPMLAAGDFDLMRPLFTMYRDMLQLATARTKEYYGHEGAFFPETLSFWGAYANSNYGWDRKDKPDGLTDNLYIRRYWQGGLELTLMMLDYYHYTGDRQFLREIGLPLAREIVTFFDQHWQRGPDGKIKFYPAQALETYWDAVNPLPEIAGLDRVLQELLALPNDLTRAAEREDWKRIRADLPALPIKRDDQGNRYMAAAETIMAKPKNKENVALYAVFPYRLYGVGRPDLELMRYTYLKVRPFRGIYRCWCNDNVFAAWLGLTDEARTQLAQRFTLHGNYRFPAFYTNGDWVPDHDNGGVAQQTIQAMLLQPVDDKIYLLPAWPKEWNVAFKLHAPGNTTVEARYQAGKITDLNVHPKERLADIEYYP